jgi:sterol desaturase/sphingolipid hydroxylase (fatty acid hydroxylase superfamily)
MDQIYSYMNDVLYSWYDMFAWLLGFAVLFGVLECLFPCNKGERAPWRSVGVDAAYYFIIPIFSRLITAIYTGFGVALLFRDVPPDQVAYSLTYGYGPLAKLPIWAQSAIIFIVSDIILYWAHRLFHTGKFWHYHAIHHSSKKVNWHSTYRFHPVNIWLTFTLVDACMVFVGFSLEAVLLMGTFNALYSAMVHANVNWTFGPFKYVFSSPVFHRWHHVAEGEGLDKNFAPTFPLLDIVFGTFYMPDHMPTVYGVHGAEIPESFTGQMLYPFRQNRKKSKEKLKDQAAEQS